MHSLPYWRLACFYFVYFAVIGGLSPYWALYLESIGLTPKLIGVVMAIPMLTRIIAPNVWGWVASKTGKPLHVMLLGCVGASLFFLGVIWRKDVAGLIFFTFAFSFFWNAILAQVEVLTLGYLKDTPERYGQIRSWGSIGFVVVVAGLGVMFDYFPLAFLPWCIFFFLIAILVSAFTLPNDPSVSQFKTKTSFWGVLKQRKVMYFLVTVFLIQLSLGIFHAFYSLYLDHFGYSKSTIGALWALGAIAEIVLFVSMPALLRKHSVNWLLGLAIITTVIRWYLLGAFPHLLWVVVVAQLFHAFTFGLTHAVAIEFVRQHFKGSSQSQGQSFYSAIGFGGANALGSLAGGVIWDINIGLMFDVALVIAVVAGVLHVHQSLTSARV